MPTIWTEVLRLNTMAPEFTLYPLKSRSVMLAFSPPPLSQILNNVIKCCVEVVMLRWVLLSKSYDHRGKKNSTEKESQTNKVES